MSYQDDNAYLLTQVNNRAKMAVIPFTDSSTATIDTGYVLPAGAVVLNVFLNVTKNVAGATINVGLVGGNAAGFLNTASGATDGYVFPIVTNTTSIATNTLGAYLLSSGLTSADGTVVYASIQKLYEITTYTHVSYTTTTSATLAGNIYIQYADPAYAQ